MYTANSSLAGTETYRNSWYVIPVDPFVCSSSTTPHLGKLQTEVSPKSKLRAGGKDLAHKQPHSTFSHREKARLHAVQFHLSIKVRELGQEVHFYKSQIWQLQ